MIDKPPPSTRWFWLAVTAVLLMRLLWFSPQLDGPFEHRQGDTAFYAWAFYDSGIDLLHPHVSWMGGHKVLALEFALPEAITALGYHLFGPHLAVARTVTLAFFTLSAGYLFLLLRRLFDADTARWTTLAYALLPVSMVFSRSLHIDFAAVAFTHMAVYHTLAWLRGGSPWHLLGFLIGATLAALIKIPYLFYFALPLAAVALRPLNWNRLLPFAAACLPVLVAFVWWRGHVHTLNSAAPDWSSWVPEYSPFVDMGSWYFGSLADRLTLANWGALANRFLWEIFTPIGLVLCGLAWRTAKQPKPAKSASMWMPLWTIGLALYLLIFFRLNAIHSYYQIPFAAWAATLIGLALTRLTPTIRLAGLGLLLLTTLGVGHWRYYQPNVYADELAGLVQSETQADELGVIVFPSTPWCDPRLLARAHRYGWAVRTADASEAYLRRAADEGAQWVAAANPSPAWANQLEDIATDIKHRRLTLYGEPVHLLVGRLPQSSAAGGRNK